MDKSQITYGYKPPLQPDSHECRICREPGTGTNRLWMPCDCQGTNAGVHLDCLEEWINTRTGEYAGVLVCEVVPSRMTVTFVVTSVEPLFFSDWGRV